MDDDDDPDELESDEWGEDGLGKRRAGDDERTTEDCVLEGGGTDEDMGIAETDFWAAAATAAKAASIGDGGGMGKSEAEGRVKSEDMSAEKSLVSSGES